VAVIRSLGREESEREVAAFVARTLREGGVAAFPTDTVYGLACSGRDGRGLARLRKLKGDRTAPFILLIARREWLGSLAARVSPLASELASRFWPGPLTLVLDAASNLEPAVVGEGGTVAVRLPASDLSVAICEELGEPVASTSANRPGGKPATSAEEVADVFEKEVDVIVDGGSSPASVPSTVVDARGAQPVLLREGAVKVDFE